MVSRDNENFCSSLILWLLQIVIGSKNLYEQYILLGSYTNTHFFLFSGWIYCRCGRRFRHTFSLNCHRQNECGYGHRCLDCTFTTDKIHLWLQHKKQGCFRVRLRRDIFWYLRTQKISYFYAVTIFYYGLIIPINLSTNVD